MDHTAWIGKTGTDQRIQSERSVCLAALRVRGDTHDTMENVIEVQEGWRPELAPDPEQVRFQTNGSAQ